MSLLFQSIFLGVLLFNISLRPMGFDAGTYHFQAIQWNEAYAIVPGLANLIRQLGFNSNWYILQAFSGFSFAGFTSLYVLNSLLLLLFVWYSSIGVTRLIQKKYTLLNFYKMLSVTCCVVLAAGKYAGEVTTDFPVIILTLWVILLLLEHNPNGLHDSAPVRFLVFILPCYLITIKVSALPLLIISLFIWIKTGLKNKLVFIAASLLLIIPWLTGNVILSGYLLFPFKGIDLFNFDWKVPDFLMRDENYSIKGWARAPYHPPDIITNMPFRQWFPIWLHEQKLYNWLFISVLGILGIINFKTLRNAWSRSAVKVIVFTLITGIVFWFTNAPDFRFAYGYLIPAMCALGSISLLHLKERKHIMRLVILAPAVLCLACFPTLMLVRHKQFSKHTILAPSPYPKPVLTPHPTNNALIIYQASWEEKCWTAPLPCTCTYYKSIKARGPSLQDGFRMSNKESE